MRAARQTYTRRRVEVVGLSGGCGIAFDRHRSQVSDEGAAGTLCYIATKFTVDGSTSGRLLLDARRFGPLVVGWYPTSSRSHSER